MSVDIVKEVDEDAEGRSSSFKSSIKKEQQTLESCSLADTIPKITTGRQSVTIPSQSFSPKGTGRDGRGSSLILARLPPS